MLSLSEDSIRYYMQRFISPMVYMAWRCMRLCFLFQSRCCRFSLEKARLQAIVQLQKMTVRQRILVTVGFASVWAALYLILKSVGAAYALLDNTVSLFGICITFLQLFAYVEYTYLMLPNSLFPWLCTFRCFRENPEQTTYLIYALYSLVCYIFQLSTLQGCIACSTRI